MRLVTYLDGGQQKLGAVVNDRVVQLPGSMLELIEAGEAGLQRARETAEGMSEGKALSEVKLLAPIPTPRRNVICVGLNYMEHFEEGRGRRGPVEMDKLPEYPTFFTKLPTAVVGPAENVLLFSHISEKLDWEVELAVILGRQGRDIPEEQAWDYVFGYTIANDVSVRDVQRRHGNQWFRGKTMDTHCPMGPWIVTKDELTDPENLRISLKVNGETKQDLNTSYLIFRIPRLIHELSLGTTLLPGDIILTGTPSGVGFARNPPEFLKDGDEMELEIEQIGTLRNRVVEYEG